MILKFNKGQQGLHERNAVIVCVCNNISDKKIREITKDGGVDCAEDAYAALGCTFCCGTCRDCAEDVVAESMPAALMAAE